MLISICAIFHVMNLKVIKWFDYLWMSQKNSDEDKSINCLPGIPLKKSSIKNDLRNMCMAIFCRESISFQCCLVFSKLLFETMSLMFSKLIFV